MAESSSRSKKVDSPTGACKNKARFEERSIKGSFIDIPLVGCSLNAENFLFNYPQSTTLLPTPMRCYHSNSEAWEETLTFNRTQDYCLISYLDSSGQDTLLSNTSEIFPRNKYDIPSTTFSDRALQILKIKIKKSRAGEKVVLDRYEGKPIYLQPKSIEQFKEAEKKEKSRWVQLRHRTEKIFAWNFEESQKFKNRIDEIEKYGELEWQIHLLRISPVINNKAFLKEALYRIECHLNCDNETVKSEKYLRSDAAWPDFCKYFAFMSWLRGDMQKCAYYLSESHGTFWKAETCDKHNLQLSRVDEISYTTKTKAKAVTSHHEILKQRIHALQSKVLMEFGNSYSNFYKQVKKNFQPSWNIIQITTDVHCSNRFGKDLADFKQMPGVWITCFNTLRSGEVQSTTHYVAKHKRNIWEERFIKLISDNKAVSEGCVKDRHLYWQTRADHNKKLRNFLETIEDWISPYAFLFPGNSKSSEMRNEYWKHVDRIKKLCLKPVNGAMSILLYKLVENFKYFPNDRINLLIFIRVSLAVTSEVATKIVDYLTKLKCETPEKEEMPRHETILILDAELERYPFDWLPIFQQSLTPVNRMFSMAHIYATAEVTKKFIKHYPNFVQPKKGTYIINPDQSLGNVQQRLEGYFGAHGWDGICGRNPTHQEFEDALQKRDFMVYCGHGSGSSIYPDWALSKLLCRSVPILMGCSSAQTKFTASKCYHSTAVHSYFSAVCPSVVGFLWEITDIECDRVTIDLLERWLPCPKGKQLLPPIPNFDADKERPKETGLSSAVMQSRFAATQFMTEAAIVVYGLPLYTCHKEEDILKSDA